MSASNTLSSTHIPTHSSIGLNSYGSYQISGSHRNLVGPYEFQPIEESVLGCVLESVLLALLFLISFHII